MNKQYRIYLTLILISFQLVSLAQFSDKKVIDKTASFDKSGRVSLNNRHGNIQIISWPKDSIKVHVEIEGESKSLSKLQETMAKTSSQISFQNTNAIISTVVSETVVSRSISDIRNLTGTGTTIGIDYKVYVPQNTKLIISNKYGDVFLDDHNGEIILELNHGNLRANHLPKLSTLSCSFGNIFITSVGSLNARLQFSEMDLEKADRLNLNSKSGTYDIDEVDDFVITSTNDNLKLGSVNTFTFNGSLSKIKLDNLLTSSTFNIKYGKVRISKIQASVCSFNIQSNRTTFDLGFAPNVSFKVSGTQNDFEILSTNPNSHIESNNGLLSGHYGSNPDSECTYLINGQKSKIYFK
ncbi:MAG: hypothetical protein KJP21_08755 [Bacteroidia bacterium]|nr:hypothetical protein [Bacteroidia bacterium]NNJ55602.1 hypothetical protein [Bacteroidia bacterium]